MKLIKLVSLLTILLAPNFVLSSPVRFTKIILKRSGGGFGGSTYLVEILSTGQVRYQGYDAVKELGKKEKLIKKKQLLELQKMLMEIEYFSLPNQYINKRDGCSEDISDMDWATITVVTPRRKKTVQHYLGCGGASSKLQKLEEYIDRVANSHQWVGTPKEWKTSSDLIKALQRADTNKKSR